MHDPYTDTTRMLGRNGRRAPNSGRRGPRQTGRTPPRRGMWAKVRLAFSGVLLLILLLAGLFYWQVYRVAGAIVVDDRRPNPPLASPLLGANILVIGVDERPDHPEEGVRSDTLILARINAARRHAALLAIPRDTQVVLPEIGVTKINVAYGQGYGRPEELFGAGTSPQQGGMAMAAQTVEQFLELPARGLRVDYTAQVNFAGFVGLIDALGGISIDVPRPIVDPEYPTADFGVTTVVFEAGRQQMDGERALIYARTRHADSDFGRAQRQQQVISAIADKFRSLGWFGRLIALPALLGSLSGEAGGPPAVLTTMPIERIDVLLGLLGLAGSIEPAEIGRFALSPETVAMSEVGSNLIWDPAGVQELITRWLSPPSMADEAALIQVLNGTTVSGLAGRVSLELEEAGFSLLPPDNAPPGDYPHSIVYNLTGKPLTARELARRLGAELRTGPPLADLAAGADILIILGADAEQ